MTRRIAIAILLTTWTALIVIGGIVYAVTRQVMVADLDERIVARALALSEKSGVVTVGPDERYVVKNAAGRTIARPTTSTANAKVSVTDRKFAGLGDGTRQRTLTLSILSADAEGDASKAITVIYSSSAERLDRLLNRLTLILLVAGAACGVASAGVAVFISRAALRPLRETADQIGAIDENRLDRRIDVKSLPPELSATGDRLNEMLGRLETAFEERTRFLADASHELRTPVAALMTTIEVALRRPRDSGQLTDSLTACLSDAKSLRQLVDRLMQQVRSQNASLSEPEEVIDAGAFIKECVDSVIRAETSAQVDVQCGVPENLHLRTERGRLRAIVTNLVSNAVTYSGPDGRVEVKCKADDSFTLTVADNGPGISPELLPRLFQPFSRGVNSRKADGHLGLGLSIVQSHVKALGGQCEVVSVPGNGAVFTVRLPKSVIMELVPSESA